MTSLWTFPDRETDTNITTLGWIAYTALTLYMTAEVTFYVYFHRVLLPHANQRQPPSPFLDYPHVTDRHKLLLRILGRLEQQATKDGVSIRDVLTEFFVQWFDKLEDVASDFKTTPTINHNIVSSPSKEASKEGIQKQSSTLTASTVSSSSSTTTTTTTTTTLSSSSSSSTSSDDTSSISSNEEGDEDPVAVDSSSSSSQYWTIPGLGRLQITEFLAWAFFTKEIADLTVEEQQELNRCLTILQSRVGLVFPEESSSSSFTEMSSPQYKARRLCLENLSPLHRPMLVYICVEVVRTLAGLVLRCNGFRSTRSHSGLMGWYRPRQCADTNRSDNGNYQEEDQKPTLLPLVFFHGIAPAGLAFYLPMIFNLIRDGRPALLVEQPSISGRFGTFGALNETEMIQAVEEMLAETVDADATHDASSPLLWAGHSFGSCPLTWMLRHESLRQRSAGLLLLDPVTILLSEPAVMLNFLYSRQISKIRMVAASELFTEYYLRRHFAWYNAEALWIDDNRANPEEASYSVTVALSACDEIVDAPKVASYLEGYRAQVRTIYWPEARHGYCITSPSKWQQLREALWQQEDMYWQQQQGRRQ